MRRDGRGLDHRTLEAIRLMAVERVRDGERPSSVIASFGFNRTTIYRWLDAAAKPGIGMWGLRSRPATGRPRSLTPRQEQQVFRWINGRDPRQYGLDFGLWTRSVVASLIEQQFRIRLGLTAVGELLAKLGLTPQKPLQRAYQRDLRQLRNGNANGSQRSPSRPKRQVAKSIFGMNRGSVPMLCTAELGAERDKPLWSSDLANGNRSVRVRGERARWVLVLHLSRRAERGVVRHLAAKDDAASHEAGALGGRRTSRTQDSAGEGLCGIHQRHADAAFSSRLRA